MEKICSTPFWNPNVTKSSYPQLTECFRQTVLQWTAPAIFWLVLPLWIWMLHRRKIQPRPLPISVLFILKMITTALFGLIHGANFLSEILASDVNRNYLSLINSLIYFITSLAIIWLTNYDRRKGMFCSGLLFTFWLIIVITMIPTAIEISINRKETDSSIKVSIDFASVWLYLILSMISFVLNCFTEPNAPKKLAPNERPVSPELYANFLSRITFSWASRLITLGYRKPLTEEDCWELQISERASNIVPRVKECLEGNRGESKTIAYERSKLSNNDYNKKQTNDEAEKQDLLKQPTVEIKAKSSIRRKRVAFWFALFNAYRGKLVVAGLMKLLHDILQFSGPMILKRLLNFFGDPTGPTWVGIFYSVLLGVTVFCQTFFLQAYFHRQILIGLRFRSAITGLVYRKSLNLSNSAKQSTTTGEIVNLMSIDATRFGDLSSYIHVLWSGPFQIVVALVLLYHQMQLAIIPGVVLLVLMIPLNLYIQRVQKQLVTQQMKLKDQRIKMMNEVLGGIKVLKLYAWEMAFIRRVDEIRDKELECIRKKAIVSAIGHSTWTFAPILVCITTFAVYVLSSANNVLTAEKAFVSLALFNLLRFPLVVFPTIINSIVEASVSNKRIQKFLSHEEIDDDAVRRSNFDPNAKAVCIENGSFRWSNSSNDPLILKNIDLTIDQGKLVAFVGSVGSGKSSALSAVLGEMTKVDGNVIVNGSIAYVPQSAWILNATLRDNILFGKDFEQKWYDEVVEACALKTDFEILPHGDQTEIGEKGINLSGGQKQRVSLARSVYNRADIYLFDDPLSAVDAHVGAHIFKQVIGPKGVLKNKTRILVTHGVSHLPKCDEIIIFSRGEFAGQGPYQKLIETNKILRDLVYSVETSEVERKNSDAEAPSIPASPLDTIIDNPVASTNTTTQKSTGDSDTKQAKTEQPESEKLIQKEKVETGSVKFNVFLIYIRACSFKFVGLVFLMFFWCSLMALSTNIWLSKWSDQSKKITSTNDTTESISRVRGISIYSILGIIQGFASFFMQLFIYLAAYVASRKLHSSILLGVLRAPMSFFDMTPIGRIINRFAKDVDSIDATLPSSFASSFGTLIQVLITIIILLYGSWMSLFALVPLAFCFAYIQRVYVATSRQLRRLDSTSRSPVYSNFGETINGLSSIRAYRVQQRFINISDRLLDKNQACYFASCISNRWLAVRLESIVNALTIFVALFAVFMRDRLTAGTVGLIITYAMQITQSLNWLVRMASDIETNIVSVERVNEYSELKSEAPWEIPESKPPKNWPNHGEIQINGLSTRYRENLELVLKNLTLHVNPGEKIGIIGRTGSGKSSFCIGLFRIIEPADGQIMIDNVDISRIGLHDLRSKITIIPQDAVIFAGTVRFNVDPYGSYSDSEIWTALELVHVKKRIIAMDDGLSHMLTEGGENLSAGERQLLCMARAILRKSKIFVLDEATASIDMETDRLIQVTIRSAFKDATVLTIAHRLHTILDSTKILVLSNGSLQEFDEPRILAADPNSAFSKLLKDANIKYSNFISSN